MTTSVSRLDRDSYARGFVRAAQYLANMLASGDVLGESQEILRSNFAPDFVCFCDRAPDRSDCCGELGLSPAGREVLARAVEQVIDTGFMAVENFASPPLACAVLPVSVRGRAEVALLVGYMGEKELPPHVLEALLGLSGLIGATLARQRADRELLVLAEERARRAIAEATERTTRLLSEASKVLFASFDYESTLGSVARLLVPRFADYCSVEVVEDRSVGSRQVAVVYVHPSNAERVCELKACEDPLPLHGRALVEGEAEFHPEAPATLPVEWARNTEQLEVLRSLGIRSAMVVPLVVRDAVWGVFALGSSSRRYGSDDLALAREIGLRAGTAIENARLYHQAQQAIGVRDHFLAMLSHEIRNPLTPIRNSLYILDHAEPAGQQAVRAKQVAGRQLAYLTRLVDDLLDVTRIARGKVELRPTRVDLSELARRTGEDHRSLMQERGVAFEVEESSQPVWVKGDETRLAQAIGNLLQNAAKFTPPGGTVRLAVAKEGNTAEIRVKDTGHGIEPKLIKDIFEPFVQATQSLARTEGGLGLGLALVKGLVELHGGSVAATSAGHNQGAQFTMRLPSVAQERVPVTVHEAETPFSRRRVLVVDDNQDAAESLADIVRMLGHHANIAHDGFTAIQMVTEDPPDLVLCDIGLPGLSGYQVAQALRADHRFDAVQLVAVSGYAQAEDRERALEAGFAEHIPKPPDPAVLLRVLSGRAVRQ